ncbi:MAG: hypothetical protein PHG82_01420 [Candidatus Gracilibacteria bacterium]|nr:hypothetical protein [Candidatus Gracilibacteria bacterium]
MQKQNFKIEDSIYPENIINQAIEDFKYVADINYTNNELIIESEDDIDEIFNEFMNYVVGLYNESN